MNLCFVCSGYAVAGLHGTVGLLPDPNEGIAVRIGLLHFSQDSSFNFSQMSGDLEAVNALKKPRSSTGLYNLVSLEASFSQSRTRRALPIGCW